MITIHFPVNNFNDQSDVLPALVLMDFNEFFEKVDDRFIKDLGKPGYRI